MVVNMSLPLFRSSSARFRRVLGWLGASGLVASAALAQPATPPPSPAPGATPPTPLLDGFTADPAIRVFGDTYYVYPTSDKPQWMTTDFSVWSSKNLVDWKKEGLVLDVTRDLAWANIKAWAPDCIERNGKWYFYFCADGKIGVGTAEKPTGPFTDALGKALLDRKADPRITSNTIDPYPFIDDDGQAYLYWGNSSGRVNVVKLNPDMVSFDGPPIEFSIQGKSSGRNVNFREGIVVFKRGGKFYFMWSVDDARSDDYRIAYGTADNPLGPVAIPENATVLSKHGPAKGTGHHSIVHVPGTDRWYAVYHRHAIPDGGGYKREVCLARMEFNPDGSIRPMDPMITPFKPGDHGEPIVNGKGLPDDPSPNPFSAATATVELWPEGKMPGKGAHEPETERPSKDAFHRITNVSRPTLSFFPAPNQNSPAPTMIVCPGGAYNYVVVDKEGVEIAAWLNTNGFNALVLKYRVPKNRAGALQDVQRALSLARARAAEWNVDSRRLGVIGFSAGGNLAAKASTRFDERTYPALDEADQHSCRPDFAVLVYPAYLATTNGHVSPDLNLKATIPPTLILHSEDDKSHVPGSRLYHAALDEARVAHEFKLYSTGGHGYGLHCTRDAKAWPDYALEWLRKNGVK